MAPLVRCFGEEIDMTDGPGITLPKPLVAKCRPHPTCMHNCTYKTFFPNYELNQFMMDSIIISFGVLLQRLEYLKFNQRVISQKAGHLRHLHPYSPKKKNINKSQTLGLSFRFYRTSKYYLPRACFFSVIVQSPWNDHLHSG